MAATAKSNTSQYDPRTRLVGAVVLVAIGIIFLPMLFNSSEQPTEDEDTGNSVVMEITSEGKKVFVSRIAPIEDVSVADSASLGLTNAEQQQLDKAPGSENDQTAAPRKPAAVKKEQKPVVKKEDNKQPSSSALIRPVIVAPSQSGQKSTKSTTRPAEKTTSAKASPKPATKPEPASGMPAGTGWMVQVGSYSKQANAEKAAGKLRAKGYTVHTNPVKTSKGTVIRVWLGPFKEKKTAEKIRSSVKRSTGMSAIIKTYKN
jgi:DedD protein